MTAPRPDAKMSEERLLESIDSLEKSGFWRARDYAALAALRELLAARERIAKLEDEREGLREVVVEAFDEWLYAAGYKGDYLMKKHGDAERVAELRARIGRTDSGEWREE